MNETKITSASRRGEKIQMVLYVPLHFMALLVMFFLLAFATGKVFERVEGQERTIQRLQEENRLLLEAFPRTKKPFGQLQD